MMTRAEHLDWAKKRALQYLDAGNVNEAFTSMGSDLSKHPELRMNNFLMELGLRYCMDGDKTAMRRWIEGFN